jgi:hypothetical protein
MFRYLIRLFLDFFSPKENGVNHKQPSLDNMSWESIVDVAHAGKIREKYLMLDETDIKAILRVKSIGTKSKLRQSGKTFAYNFTHKKVRYYDGGFGSEEAAFNAREQQLELIARMEAAETLSRCKQGHAAFSHVYKGSFA